MRDELLNLVASFVEDGLDFLSKRGAGEIIDRGTTSDSSKAVLFRIMGRDYLISVEPYQDASQPEIIVNHIDNDPTGIDASLLGITEEDYGKHDAR